jgi:hypothetical protein
MGIIVVKYPRVQDEVEWVFCSGPGEGRDSDHCGQESQSTGVECVFCCSP